MVKLILTNFEPIWILQVWNCDHTCYINTLRRKAVYMWEKNQMHIWGENGTSWKRLERNKGEKKTIFCVYALKYLIQVLSYLDHLFLLVQQLWIDHKVAQKNFKKWLNCSFSRNTAAKAFNIEAAKWWWTWGRLRNIQTRP